MSAIPIPEGNNIQETFRRLKAIDAEFFSMYAASGKLGDLEITGDVTIGAGGTLEVGDIHGSINLESLCYSGRPALWRAS